MNLYSVRNVLLNLLSYAEFIDEEKPSSAKDAINLDKYELIKKNLEEFMPSLQD